MYEYSVNVIGSSRTRASYPAARTTSQISRRAAKKYGKYVRDGLVTLTTPNTKR